jgi:hypothetical protein
VEIVMTVVDQVVEAINKSASSGKEDRRQITRLPESNESADYSSKLLQEITLRTGAIAIYLAKVKQYANKVDSGVMKLKTLSNSLKSIATDEERNKLEGEIVKVDADVLMALRKMQMYSALVSASGGLGAPKETAKLIKQMEKRKRR